MKKDFGIYIHWPYCLSKCPYCDFYSLPCQKADETLMQRAYLRDIALIPCSYRVTSIFFGGGTPSLMSPQLVQDILKAIDARFDVADDVEISMEVNPDAIDKAKMADLKVLGVNRLSVGVQSLDPSALTFLGRRHNLQSALSCVTAAMDIFDNVSMDLMYARPKQTVTQWMDELDKALALGLPHYSLYQLTIEDGTAFARRGIVGADEETARALFLATLEKMEKAGIPAYEVSNFAKSGYTCRHNQTYWRGFDYAGVGAGAHGRLGNLATENPSDVGAWLRGERQTNTLTITEKQEEKLILGLRHLEGVDADGLSPAAIQQALDNAWIVRKGNRIIPTVEGWLMLNPLTVLLSA